MSIGAETSRASEPGGPAGPPVRVRPWSPAARLLMAVVVLACGVGLRAGARVGRGVPQRVHSPPPVLKVDPNTATAPALEALPRVGPSLAARIIAERRARPFASIADLRRRVRGIGPVTLARLAPFLNLDRESGPEDSPAPSPMVAASAAREAASLGRDGRQHAR